MDVFYFHAHYGFEGAARWEERDEYGFLIASDFNTAMKWVTDYYAGDLLSVEIKYAGDTGMISINNKQVAEAFMNAYQATHYED